MPKNKAQVRFNTTHRKFRKKHIHIIIFAGMRGAGKDELMAKFHQLFDQRDVVWANVGQILEEEVASGSQLGRQIKDYDPIRAAGGLLPGGLAFAAVDKWIAAESQRQPVKIVLLAGGSRSFEENMLWITHYEKVIVVFTEVAPKHVKASIKTRQQRTGIVRSDEKPKAVKRAWSEFKTKTKPGLALLNGELVQVQRTMRMRDRFEKIIPQLRLDKDDENLLLGRLRDPKHPVSVGIDRIDAIDHPRRN